MKPTVVVDPAIYEAGPATPSIRELLAAHAAIDWFERPSIDPHVARARFLAYHALAREHAPDLFVAAPNIELAPGGWPEFRALCGRARTERHDWDWKFGALKPLSKRHAGDRAWAASLPALPTESSLAFRYHDAMIWTVKLPTLDTSALAADDAEAARFYTEYANLDAIEGIEWQLAEAACPLDKNPYALLSRVYAGGYYPFHFGANDVVLLSFAA